MATSLKEFSTTAASNTAVGSANVAEGCPPSGINNAIREFIAYVVDWFMNTGTIASASTTDIGTKTQGYLAVSGTTTITAFGTPTNKTEYTLKFDGALILTHNATSLILPSGANVTTIAGEVAKFRHEGSGNWRCVSYPARWLYGDGTSGQVLTSAGAGNLPTFTSIGLPTGYLTGLKVSNNGSDAVNDIDIASGKARSDGDAADLTLASTHVKQIDVTFAEYSSIGTASGGRDSGDNLTGAKWFRVYLIGGSGKNTQAFISTSSSPTLPSGFTWKRRIDFIYWNGSTIVGFKRMGNWRRWNTPTLDVDTSTLGTTATNFALNLPTGYRWWVMGPVFTNANAAGGLHVASADVTDSAPSASAAPLGFGAYSSGPNSGQGWITPFTDTSSQIRARADAANRTFRFSVHGWYDDCSEY